MVLGANSCFANIPPVIEAQVEFISDLISRAQRTGAAVEHTEEESYWTATCKQIADATLFPRRPSHDCQHPGKPYTVLFYMGGLAPYRQMLADVARADYAGFFQHPALIPRAFSGLDRLDEDAGIVTARAKLKWRAGGRYPPIRVPEGRHDGLVVPKFPRPHKAIDRFNASLVFDEAQLRRVLKNYASYSTRSGGISHWARMRRILGVRKRSAASQQCQSSAGFIINASGFSNCVEGGGGRVAHRVHRLWDRMKHPGPVDLWAARGLSNFLIECNRVHGCRQVSIGLEHGVEDHDDPAHHCHQRDFFELAACKQPFIKLLAQRIKADRTQRAHVKLASDRISSAPDDPAAPPGAAVIGERSDSDQGGGGLAAERAQFGQLGQHRGAEHLAHPRKAAQHLALAAPGLRAPHGLVEVIVDLGDAALQVSDMLAQLFTHLRAGALKSLLLRHAHLEQLVAPGGQFLYAWVSGIQRRSRHGLLALREQREQPGIDAVGLRQ